MSSSIRTAILSLLLLSALLTTLPHVASAAPGQSPMVAELTVQRVVPDGKGGETFDEAERASPGDVIAYTCVYRNRGNSTLRGVRAALPIPPGTELLPETVSPPIAEASLDGAKFLPVPVKRRVKDAAGTEKEEDVPVSEYRSVRWDLKHLAAGQAVTVRLRVKILDLKK